MCTGREKRRMIKVVIAVEVDRADGKGMMGSPPTST
jgi:hypothetical protein